MKTPTAHEKDLIFAQHLAKANGYELFIRPIGTARFITNARERQHVLRLPGCRWVANGKVPYKNAWTREEDDKLKKLVSEGVSMPKLAMFFPNRSPDAVAKRRADIKAKPPPKWFSHHNKACIAEILKCKMAGWTHERVAEVYGEPISSVSWLLCKAGFKRFRTVNQPTVIDNKNRWSEIEIAKLRKLCSRFHLIGFTHEHWKHIALQLPNRSLRAVRKKGGILMKYWRTPEELKLDRKRREKWLKWRVY